VRPAIEPIVTRCPRRLDHPGHNRPQGVDRTEHVHPYEPLGLLGAQVGERAVGADAGAT
jgi:hypothetical protein